MDLRLDSEHRYWLGPQQVHGFTEIARAMGIIAENPFYTAEGRDQGTAIHQWLLFLAQGQEPECPPDERILGRVEAIKKFLYETGFKFVGGEKPVYETISRYACTPDLWGHIGQYSAVIDAKRGGKLGWHPLQTAAQRMALACEGFAAQRRFTLYLSDGSYKLEEHKNNRDFDAWKAVVAAFHTREAYK